MRKTILALVLTLASILISVSASQAVTRIPHRCESKPATILCAIHFHHDRVNHYRAKMGMHKLKYGWYAEHHKNRRLATLRLWRHRHADRYAKYRAWEAQHRSGYVGGGNAVSVGQAMAAARGWTGSQWDALYKLWSRESGWNPNAYNSTSGACGIPQALPCSKIPDHSVQGQIAWGLSYIAGSYGNPAAAWAHSEAYGWY